MAFEPGSFVVCVDAAEHKEWYRGPYIYFGTLDGLTKGRVYTVRAAYPHPAFGTPTVDLVEIVRERVPSGQFAGFEIGFAASRFRPLRDEALSVFRQALEPSPKQTETA